MKPERAGPSRRRRATGNRGRRGRVDASARAAGFNLVELVLVLAITVARVRWRANSTPGEWRLAGT